MWSTGGYVLSQAVRFGSNLVMTRLLVPEMFGVMAIAWLVINGLALFSDVGLQQSVVQSRRGDDPRFLNTVWAIQIRRGFLIALCAWVVSLLVGLANHWGVVPAKSVYAERDLPFVIAAVAFCAIVSGFDSTKLLEASRRLSLGRVAGIELVAQVAGLASMLIWTIFERSIWALVVGGVCSALVKMALSHAWLPGAKNRWQWDSTAFNEVIHFGKWIFVSSVLGYLVNSGDRLLLGGLIDAGTLGVYVIAYFVYRSGEQMLTKVIGDVSFPALSEVARERPAELKRSYYQFHRVVAALTYFGAGVLMTSGRSLIDLLYDQRYAQAGPILQVFGVALFTVPYHISFQCFMALGVPRLLPNIAGVRLIALCALTLAGFHLGGFNGAVIGIVASYFSWIPLSVIYLIRFRIFDLRKELLPLPFALGGTAVGWLVNYALQN
jgi:O-antigen/teichoic acid export membrane protein